MPILVKEIMSKPAVTIDYNKTAKDAGKLMRKNRIGFLVATKKSKATGIISDADLINKIIVGGKSAQKTKVKALMSRPLIIVSPEEEVMEAVKKIKKNNIHRLPVVDKGKVVGVLSLTDIARSSPEMYYLLEYRQEMKRHPIVIKEEVSSGICDSCDNYSEHLKKTIDGRWLCEICRDETEERDEFEE